MKTFLPDYYNAFSCLAAGCPDSCCHEWEVDIDEDTARLYRSLPGPLGDRLRQVLRTEDGDTLMTIEAGRCPMWRPDGLCRIQAELGHDALSFVCRTFPRLRQDYGDFAELSLELSCPEAARLILQTPWDITCVESAEPGQADYDQEAMDILLKSRQVAESYVLSGEQDLPGTLTALLFYGYEVQQWLDGGEAPVFDPARAVADGEKFAGRGDLTALTDYFAGLEILTDRWRQRLRSPAPGLWTDQFRPLLRYFLRRYWLQAVWDYDLVCRVKFIVTACILINALGGDLTDTAQLFSKEIENDPDNLEAILDGAYTAPALTDVNLLGLLKNRT